MRSDNWFIFRRPNDNIASDSFSSKVEYTESVGIFFDTAIGQLERNRAHRLNSQFISYLFWNPSSGGTGINEKRDFLLPLKIMNVGDCEIYVDITHGLNLL